MENNHIIPSVIKEHLSDESIEVMSHFGLEAPKLLNEYCCALEDALIEQVKVGNELKEMLAHK